MPPAHLHVIGIDPGDPTGWARLTVPRGSIYGKEPGSFLDIDVGRWDGSPEKQTLAICRHAKGVQGMDYPVGPAIVVRNSSGYADEIYAMLRYAQYRGEMGNEIFAPILLPAYDTVTDEELMAFDLYDAYDSGSRDAMRTALAFLRLAKEKNDYRDSAWPKLRGEPG